VSVGAHGEAFGGQRGDAGWLVLFSACMLILWPRRGPG
jgi:hypothetical protein